MKSPIPYIGLFLIAITLFANERTHLSAGSAKSVTAKDAPEESLLERKSASAKLQDFYDQLMTDSVLKTKQDGVRLVRDQQSVTLQFSGDDVYADGEQAMRESWYPTLERIAEIIHAAIPSGLKIQVRGYAESGSENERTRNAFGRSEFEFSYLRAEWLAHFLESKSRIELRKNVVLTGAGAAPKGRRIELEFTFPES